MPAAPDARTIVAALKGRWTSTGGTCRCPAHEDRRPSLSVSQTRDGRVLVHCFAGCSQQKVTDALKARGLWSGEAHGWEPMLPRKAIELDDRALWKRRFARRIWRRAYPIESSPGELYFRARGITDPLPPTIKFARLRHVVDKCVKPAAVCAIQESDGKVTAIQRIFLRPDGAWKTDADPAKATLGPMGNGALRLGPVGTAIGMAEGPETGLSAQQLFGMTVWCACGAGRMPRVNFPDVVEEVHIFADAGKEGKDFAIQASDEYKKRGLKAVIRAPKKGDWNDVLRGLDK